MTARTAAQLRAEYHDRQHALEVAEARWELLDDGPEAFEQRAAVATEIRMARSQLATLPAAIARAEERESAIASLHEKYAQLHCAATRQLADVIDELDRITRDRLVAVMTACAATNQVRMLLASHGDSEPALPRPLNASIELRRAFQGLGRRLALIPPAAIRPDAAAWRAELATLTGAQEGAQHATP